MNRLQKKCVIATVGIHLLLLIIFIFGPGFFNRQSKNDDTQVLNVIPANLVDDALNSGVQNATPPPPTPAPVTPQLPPPLPPQPVQTPPQPAPKIVEPAPVPVPNDETLTERLKDFMRSLRSEPTPEPAPTPKPAKPQDNIQINTQLVKQASIKITPKTDKTSDQRAINNTLKNLSKSLSSSTKIDMPGNASASYANYATVVRSIYEQMMRTQSPGQVANQKESTKVRIVIAKDGTVISSEITSPSGDSAWDDAVQRTLDKVTMIAPFPDGVTDNERHYNLSFSPEIEQSLE